MLEIVLIHMCQQLTITFNCLPALAVSIVFSGTIEVGLQEAFPGYIQHKSSEYVLSELFQKKKKRTKLRSSESQPSVTSLLCIALEDTRIAMISPSKGSFPWLVLVIWLGYVLL